MVEFRRPGIAALAVAACLPLVGGCATKGFVRDRIGELETRMEGEHTVLGEDVARSSRTAGEALARADAASGAAGSARSLALGDVDYRVVDEYTVQFAFDSAELSPESRTILDGAVAATSANPRMLVDVLGHADSTGPDAYNDELSRRRAAAVVQYLVLHGPGPVSRYALVGLGETSPVLTASREDRAASRRVVVSLLERAEPGSVPEAESSPVISRSHTERGEPEFN